MEKAMSFDWFKKILVKIRQEERNKCLEEYSFYCSKLLKEERQKAKKEKTEMLEEIRQWVLKYPWDLVGQDDVISKIQTEIEKLEH